MFELQNFKTWAREYFRENPKAKWITIAVVALILLSIGRCAFAQAPVATLTVTPATAEGSATPRLEWSVTNPSQGMTCTASGHANWTGAKPLTGSVTLPAVAATTAPVTVNYRIECTSPALPGDTDATLSWTPPTTNTDGSALVNLAGYRIAYGNNQATLSQSIQVSNPAATSYVVTGLTTTTYFTVRAYNTTGAESSQSNMATFTPAPGVPAVMISRTASLTVNPPKVPSPPTQLQVASSQAWSVELEWERRRLVFVLDRKIGEVPVGTACRKDFRIAGTNYYRVDVDAVKFNRPRDRTFLVVANCHTPSVEIG
jgi:hypothetical protein